MKTNVTVRLDPKLLALSRQNKVNLSQRLEQSLQDLEPEYAPKTHKLTVSVNQPVGENKSKYINKAIRYYLGKHPELLHHDVVSDDEFETLASAKGQTQGLGEPCTIYVSDLLYMIIRLWDLCELVDNALKEYNEQFPELLAL